jgi:hypothetical protein
MVLSDNDHCSGNLLIVGCRPYSFVILEVELADYFASKHGDYTVGVSFVYDHRLFGPLVLWILPILFIYAFVFC